VEIAFDFKSSIFVFIVWFILSRGSKAAAAVTATAPTAKAPRKAASRFSAALTSASCCLCCSNS